jgi:hypothetical protein
MLWMDELVLFLVNELFRQGLESLSVVALCTCKVWLPSEFGFAHLQILASL